MKAISKAQVIDLFSNIRRDGVENTNYDVDVFVSSHKPEEIGRASCRERV